MTTHFCLGFAFSSDLSRVLLIRKNKPAWQAGRLNGIGGKVEPTDEGLKEAMVREFREETGLKTRWNHWHSFAEMVGPDFKVDCFAAVLSDLASARSVESEPLEVWSAQLIHGAAAQMQDNLPWLIPLAIDNLRDGQPAFVTAKYSEWPVKSK